MSPGQTASAEIGELLRSWRTLRQLTQLDLALAAGVSARHLSFIETGRSRPSAEMVLLLAEQLEVPLRERNRMLLAAGYAPTFPELSMDEPPMAPVREALDVILDGHEPNPAVVVDRHWNLVAANATMAALAKGADERLLEPPVNVMRLGLHPGGLAASIVNLAQVRGYFIGRLERQVAISGDPELAALLEEVARYPAPPGEREPAPETGAGNILTPLMRMRFPDSEDELSLFFSVATFGTAVEVTASELSIELGFPADLTTVEALRKLPRR
jgi:transcriptional regulator with XRE-family HTH domain